MPVTRFSSGSGPEASNVIASLSLIAREGTEVRGVALCVEKQPGSYHLTLSVGSDDGGVQLERQLLDKALHKLASRGIRKCTISGSADSTSFWSSASWAPQHLEHRPDSPEGRSDAATGEAA